MIPLTSQPACACILHSSLLCHMRAVLSCLCVLRAQAISSTGSRQKSRSGFAHVYVLSSGAQNAHQILTPLHCVPTRFAARSFLMLPLTSEPACARTLQNSLLCRMRDALSRLRVLRAIRPHLRLNAGKTRAAATITSSSSRSCLCRMSRVCVCAHVLRTQATPVCRACVSRVCVSCVCRMSQLCGVIRVVIRVVMWRVRFILMCYSIRVVIWVVITLCNRKVTYVTDK